MRPRLMRIPGFAGYLITRNGRVWSEPRPSTKGGWLRPCKTKDGYLRTKLTGGVPRFVHRLVLEAFVGPCPDGMEACHNNGDRTDNRLENLRWDTRSANCMDAVKQGTAVGLRRGENHGHVKLTEQQVRQIIYTWQTGLFTQAEIAKQYGTKKATVQAIASHRNWGYLWSTE